MKTEIIKVTDYQSCTQASQAAVDALNAGKLVGFPTETVYGIAARADIPSAVQNLDTLKQRPPDKPFSIIIGNKAVLPQYVGQLPPIDQALLRRAWPGPLTAVFVLNDQKIAQAQQNWPPQLFNRLYQDQTIGIRLPDHQLAQHFLTTVDAPILAPSANLAGKKPPRDAQDVLEQLDGKIDLLLDAGPTKYAQASTVVKFTDSKFEILRPGVLDSPTIERMRQLVFLFVCTGNTCRSPMAEGICRTQIAQKLRCPVDQLEKMGYKILSAGTMAPGAGGKATPEAIQACQKAGIDISNHRARPLTQEIINQADYIFTMGRSHRQIVEDIAPDSRHRVALLADDDEISDPIGGSLDRYQHCYSEIAQAIDQRLSEIFTE
ncbi:MAG: threonylcarbamoyl-AMP synthase [Sedimentisphaerales bacterium]|nr:threonylcarbamoyl-AMP synthase [Sedimentisphaerales bacterium]